MRIASLQRYRVAYLFAQRAAEIPFPEEDSSSWRGRTGLSLARNR